MEKFVPLATTNAPPTPAAEFSRKATCRGVVPKTPDPCNPPADCRIVTRLVTLRSASAITQRPAGFLLEDSTTSNAYTITGKWGRRVTQHKQAHLHTTLQSSENPKRRVLTTMAIIQWSTIIIYQPDDALI